MTNKRPALSLHCWVDQSQTCIRPLEPVNPELRGADGVSEGGARPEHLVLGPPLLGELPRVVAVDGQRVVVLEPEHQVDLNTQSSIDIKETGADLVREGGRGHVARQVGGAPHHAHHRLLSSPDTLAGHQTEIK